MVAVTRNVVGLPLEEEVRIMPREERQKLLGEIRLPLEIPIDHCLAMKSSLSLSWTTLRTLRRYVVCVAYSNFNLLFLFRWLKIFKVSLASENKQRNLAKEIVGELYVSENAPFSFSVEGRQEIKVAPYVYVSNLVAAVSDHLLHHQQ